jgi:hypothetical protein
MARDLISEAKQAQATGGYRADVWVTITLEAMTKVWQGVGGESNFFFSEEDAREAKGAYVGTRPYRFAETLWRLAQVQPNAKLGLCASPIRSSAAARWSSTTFRTGPAGCT